MCLGIEDSAGLVVDNLAGLLELGADLLGPGSFADCPHSYAAADDNSAAADQQSPDSADKLLLM